MKESSRINDFLPKWLSVIILGNEAKETNKGRQARISDAGGNCLALGRRLQCRNEKGRERKKERKREGERKKERKKGRKKERTKKTSSILLLVR